MTLKDKDKDGRKRGRIEPPWGKGLKEGRKEGRKNI